MDWQAIAADLREHLWLYLSLPLVSAGIGYATKVLAIEMMFRPVEFIGLRPYLGWQGVVPRKAEKMAGMAVEQLTSQLISVREVFLRLDPQKVARQLEPPLALAMERITHDVAERYQPGLWTALPDFVKRRVIERAQASVPATVIEIMQDVGEHIEQLFDLKHMVVGNLVRDKALLNRIFWQIGRQEFRFFGTAGFYFGFAIGLVQMVAWALTKEPWLLPAFGLFTGFASDWLALQMLFRPLRPRRILGITVQGLFIRRQQEVAHDYAALIAEQLITPEKLWVAILQGPRADHLIDVVHRHVRAAVDENAGLARPLVAFAIGSRQYVEIKNAVAAGLMAELPRTLRHMNRYAENAMDLRNTLVKKLQALTPEEFEGLLRPVFKEDEWILITIGALLGFLVGEMQVLLIVH